MSGTAAYAIAPREAVREAYSALAVANYDYEGHRAKAMKEVQEVGRALGLELSGERGDRNQDLRLTIICVMRNQCWHKRALS